jgi:outer membrane immunogenic protein
MKKQLSTSIVISALLAGSAFAADLPSIKSAPIVAPAPMWTGFYAGLNAGYGWGTNANTYSGTWSANNWQTIYANTPEPLAGNNIIGGQVFNSPSNGTQSGFLGGGQVGYNYQMPANLLLGFEADFQGSLIRGGGSSTSSLYGSAIGQLVPGGNATYSYKASQIGYANTAISGGLDYLGTARARFGYNLTPSFLVYATGGLAYGGAWANATTTASSNLYSRFDQTLGANIPVVNQVYFGQQSRQSSLLVGYSAGGGFEWLFSPNWSVKTEAIYYNLGNMNVSTNSYAGAAAGARVENPNNVADILYSSSAAGIMSTSARLNYQGIIARLGVNYHFNFASAPVVAKF